MKQRKRSLLRNHFFVTFVLEVSVISNSLSVSQPSHIIEDWTVITFLPWPLGTYLKLIKWPMFLLMKNGSSAPYAKKNSLWKKRCKFMKRHIKLKTEVHISARFVRRAFDMSLTLTLMNVFIQVRSYTSVELKPIPKHYFSNTLPLTFLMLKVWSLSIAHLATWLSDKIHLWRNTC